MNDSKRTVPKGRYEFRCPSSDGDEHVEYQDEERWAVEVFAYALAERLTDRELAAGEHYRVIDTKLARVVIEYTTRADSESS